MKAESNRRNRREESQVARRSIWIENVSFLDALSCVMVFYSGTIKFGCFLQRHTIC